MADCIHAAAFGVGILQGRWIFIGALVGLAWLRGNAKRQAWKHHQITCLECRERQ
jgi:hypothetical protein